MGGLAVCLGKWQRWDGVALSGCYHREDKLVSPKLIIQLAAFIYFCPAGLPLFYIKPTREHNSCSFPLSSNTHRLSQLSVRHTAFLFLNGFQPAALRASLNTPPSVCISSPPLTHTHSLYPCVLHTGEQVSFLGEVGQYGGEYSKWLYPPKAATITS